MRARDLFILVCVGASLPGCLGARADLRNYYVLNREASDARAPAPVVEGLVRVRTLDTDSVYEKFQIVVRQSPYQLRYSDSNVWAVKPDQMISDLVADTLIATNTFSAVTRELIDTRPKYTLAGTINAVEIYDSDDLWFAHLAFSLQLNRFADGKRVWSFDFDRRRPIEANNFAHGVRALSEILAVGLEEAVRDIAKLDLAHPDSTFEQPAGGGRWLKDRPAVAPKEPIQLPERRSPPPEVPDPSAPTVEPPSGPEP